jgi:Protein of unknown function (DUF3306)
VVDPQKIAAMSENTLSRWSRLKTARLDQKKLGSRNSEIETNAQEIGAIKEIADSAIDATSVAPMSSDETATPVSDERALPSLNDIALDRDFTPFMQAKIPETLKRQALKTLFKDAHFNTMDGLDTYIDDYTKFEPITAAELEGLSAWKSIMKPLEQVVTPGGYAVDVESEEGRAVLAAREALARDVKNSSVVGDESMLRDYSADQATEDTTATSALPHERYGKRVGDFKSNYAPLSIEENTHITQPVESPAKLIADDPR